MQTHDDEITDELRPEYDLTALKVRNVGQKRTHFRGQLIQLAPDVAELFPDSESVNEALRFLIRITRENTLPTPDSNITD